MINKDTKEQLVNDAKEAIEFANSSFFNVNETPILYHYSTIEALFNGILVKPPVLDERAISFFATDHRYLNDEKEIKHGCDIMRDVTKRYFKLDFSKDEEIFQDTKSSFIISFSKESDSLPMWSTYGNRGDGIALGFDSSTIVESLKDIRPCLYKDRDIKKYLIDILTKLTEYNTDSSDKDEFVRRFYRLGFVQCQMLQQIKNEYYSYEREVRFATYDKDEIHFRYRNNLIIPYSMQYLPRKALKKIVIGPDLDFDKTKRSIQEYIESIGFYDIEIIHSKAPFRNL